MSCAFQGKILSAFEFRSGIVPKYSYACDLAIIRHKFVICIVAYITEFPL